MSEREPLPYDDRIKEFARQVEEAEVIIVGGASGLSAAGGGDIAKVLEDVRAEMGD